MITNEAAELQKEMTRSQKVESHLEGPEHPSLWLFFSSQAPHIIETGPLEKNRRQGGTVDC
jgi:hypothetical protein